MIRPESSEGPTHDSTHILGSQQPVMWLQAPNQRLKSSTLGIIFGTELAWAGFGIALLLWH